MVFNQCNGVLLLLLSVVLLLLLMWKCNVLCININVSMCNIIIIINIIIMW